MRKVASITVPQRGYGQRLALRIKDKNPASFVHNPGLGSGGWLVERTDGRPLTVLKSDFDEGDLALAWRALPELIVSGKVETHDAEKLVIAPVKGG